MLKEKHVFALILAMGLVGRLILPAAGDPDPEESYESYYLFLGDYPSEAEVEWSEEAQGITHDSDHWFITQKDALWKIPVTHNLSADVSGNPDVHAVSIGEIPGPYDHFGDLTCFDGYLVVPVTGDDPPIIAVFRAADLNYLGSSYVHPRDDPEQSGASWAAVDPRSGYVFTNSSNSTSRLYKYQLITDTLPVTLEFAGEVVLLNDDGSSPLVLDHHQGGVFSSSGHLLYLVSGYCDERYSNDGINVFDTQTWRRVRRSTNGEMPFNYQFEPGTCADSQEPQGITIWDLDDDRAPGVEGQLHVLLLENDWFINDDDDVYLKHYTEAITVDAAYSGDEYGTPLEPFNTVSEAYDMAWGGQRIKIRAGAYPETLILSKRLQVLAIDGVVTIGE